MKPRFEDKVMVVTGAAQGIGRTVAERAAAEGARVLIVDRSPARKGVVKAIRTAGGTVEAISVDLETWAGCEKAMQKAIDLWGRIDILINNVGGTIWAKPFEHYEPKQIDAEVRRTACNFVSLADCPNRLPGNDSCRRWFDQSVGHALLFQPKARSRVVRFEIGRVYHHCRLRGQPFHHSGEDSRVTPLLPMIVESLR